MMFKNLTFIDLFAGIGGFRIALEAEGAKCVFSSEIDKAAARAYYENFGDYPAGDITKISERDIPKHDVLCAGFPCQPFSIAGYRKGFEDSRGVLFFDIARILAFHQPEIFILENVPGLLSHNKGETFNTMKTILADLGYYIWYDILIAVDFGIPQNRKRIFIVGFRDKRYLLKFKKNFSKPKVKLRSLKEILDLSLDPSILKPTERALENLNVNLERKGIFISNLSDEEFIIASEIRPSRAIIRINPKIFPTLPAKMGTGGNNVPVIVKKNYIRKLSVREGLDLMGFPDTFFSRENYMQSYKQIGNSVVVPVVQYLFKSIKRTISD